MRLTTATTSRRSVCCSIAASRKSTRFRRAGLHGLALLRFLPVNFGQRGIKRLCRAIKICVLGSLGNLCQHDIDEAPVVRLARALRNNIESNLDGALQFRERLIEVQSLLRSKALGERDDHATLQTHHLRRLNNTALRKDIDQFLRALADRQRLDTRIPSELKANGNGLGGFRCRYCFPGSDPTDISPVRNVPAT